MRARLVAKYRREYELLLAEARAAAGLDEAGWKAVEPVFRRHFAPMEKALEAFSRSPVWQPPDVRRVVGSSVAGTLEDLRAAMDGEAWKKFDAWRRPEETSADAWRHPRCAYFLLPGEYESVTAGATAALRWNLARPAFEALCGRLELPAHEREDLEAVFRDHLTRYSAAVGGPGAGARRPPGATENARQAVELTEKKLLALLGEKRFRTYAEWKAELSGPARVYFHPGAVEPAGE
jgi:hypothetical protein